MVTTFLVSAVPVRRRSREPQGEAEPRDVGVLVPQLAHVFMRRVYEPRPTSPATMAPWAPTQEAEHLAHARQLAERDEALARELEIVRELDERAGAVRARAREIDAGLERIPEELAELEARRRETERATASARAELESAEARLSGLEGSRRTRPEEIDRARSEAETARELLADAEAQLERLTAAGKELRPRSARRARAPRPAARGGGVADDIHGVARVAESARTDPGTTLGEIEERGRPRPVRALRRPRHARDRARAGRHRGERARDGRPRREPGASSVAVVRRRVEERLG